MRTRNDVILAWFVLVVMQGCGSFGHAQQLRPAWTSSNIKGTPEPPAPYAIRPAFANLSFKLPTSLTELPGGRMLVSEIGGSLLTFEKRADVTQADELLKIDGATVWHATIHPQFASSGLLFVCYAKNRINHVSSFQVNDSHPPTADPASEVVLLTWPSGGHNAGCIQFGVDGMLYISTGDGSGPNPPDSRTAGQDVSNLFGCVLRINVDSKGANENYAIPADNPFVDLEGARPEIWAYGLRNPWKFGVDPQSGNIFAADNGWETWEMVHRIVRGGNCGWPIMEGRAVLRGEVKPGPTPIRPPVKDHPHSEANSVIGGPVYRGSALPDLDGTFVYGDYITGTIWGLKSDGEDTYSHRTLVDTDQRITAFAQGSDGELFVLDYDYTGQIYRLVPSGLEDRSADFPRRLSETGLFTSLNELRAAPGVVEYGVNVDRWVDGAKTRRWVAIAGNGSIKFADEDSPAVYPEGTVFVKHLTHRKPGTNPIDVPIETQLLHYENGTWHPYTYIWGSVFDDRKPLDATLADAAGEDHQVVWAIDEAGKPRGPNWHFSATNECRLCHNAGSGFVLGFVPVQLDRTVLRTPSEHVSDQLRRLAEEKTVTQLVELPDDDPGRLVDPHDEKQDLDDRARSYLHGNCSACHHPGGNAIVSFYLRRDLPFEKLRTDTGTGIGTFGIRNAKLIAPGDPYRSILLYRMNKLGYGRMPYIGSRVVDSKGVALIERWIRSLPHTSTAGDSQLIRPGSPDLRALADLTSASQPVYLPQDADCGQLLESTEGAMALTLAMHSGAIHSTGEQEIYESAAGDIRGLFETFVPAERRRKTLGQNPQPDTILSLNGNADRGRLIFFSDGARCRNCHDVADQAKSTGPTLLEMRAKYTTRSEMLGHILNPSLKIDEKFVGWIISTHDGQIHNGLKISENDQQLVLRTAERKTIRISKSEIDGLRKSAKSLMPDGILSDLTAQEAADLMMWLQASP